MKNCLSKVLTVIFAFTSYSQASEIVFNIDPGCEVISSARRNVLEIEGTTSNVSFQTRFDDSLMVNIFTPENSPQVVEKYASPKQQVVGPVTIGQNICCDVSLEDIDFKYNWHNIHNSGYIRSANIHSYLDTFGFSKDNDGKVQFTPASQARIDFNNSGYQDNPLANLIFGAFAGHLPPQSINQAHQAPPNDFIFQKISLTPWKGQARNVPLSGTINFPGNFIDISVQGGKLTLEAAPKYTFKPLG